MIRLSIFILLYGCAGSPEGTPACKQAGEKQQAVQPQYCDTVLAGDLDNNQLQDTIFILTPPTLVALDEQGRIEYELDCVDGNCYNNLLFSCDLPDLFVDKSVWGRVENAGDLNGDGISELLFVPGWFSGSATHLCLYSLKKDKWIKVAAVSHRRNDDEPLLTSKLLKKNNRYYLCGVLFDGHDTPYEMQVELD